MSHYVAICPKLQYALGTPSAKNLLISILSALSIMGATATLCS